MISKSCEVCGVAFDVKYPSWAARRRTCSQICAHRIRGVNPVTTRYRRITINGKRVQEHRHVVEQATGKKLDRSVVVHHENENRTDNAPRNLHALTHKEHSVLHNQKHPIVKSCVICGISFTPAPTKRKRAQTCGKRECWSALLSRRWDEFRSRKLVHE